MTKYKLVYILIAERIFKMKSCRLVKSIAAVFTATAMCASFSVSAYSEFEEITQEAISSKITSRLLYELEAVSSVSPQGENVESSNTVPVLIWCSDDINYNTIEAQVASMQPYTSYDYFESDDEIWLNNDSVYSDEYFETSDFSIDAETLALSNQIQASIEEERALARAMYSDMNGKFAEEHLQDYDIVYVSQYSPVVIAELDYEGVTDLAATSDTEFLDYYYTSSDDEMEVSIPVIRANTVQNNYGFTGSGIKIGQVEADVPDVTSAQLAPIASRIHIYPDNSAPSPHATMVASIMVGQQTASYPKGVAPGATLYCASKTNAGGYIQAIEWLLSSGVNVINASTKLSYNNVYDNENTYDSTAKWIDHIAINHSVHFVKSAGNSGASGVTSGGMAYNAITVGNIDDKNTLTLQDDTLRSTSSYSTSTLYAYKPDLCAPGTNINTSIGSDSGTSLAAPHVAATIALLCQQKPALKTQQDVVKAVLTASVNPNSPHKYRPTQNGYRQYGAGLLDSYRACWITANTRYYSSSMTSSQTSKTFNMNVTSSDTLMRVSLAFLQYNKFSSSTHTSLPTVNATPNLNLYIYSPSGKLVASSTTANNNVEIAEFVPTEYGTYSIKVTNASSSSNTGTIYFGLSWL